MHRRSSLESSMAAELPTCYGRRRNSTSSTTDYRNSPSTFTNKIVSRRRSKENLQSDLNRSLTKKNKDFVNVKSGGHVIELDRRKIMRKTRSTTLRRQGSSILLEQDLCDELLDSNGTGKTKRNSNDRDGSLSVKKGCSVNNDSPDELNHTSLTTTEHKNGYLVTGGNHTSEIFQQRRRMMRRCNSGIEPIHGAQVTKRDWLSRTKSLRTSRRHSLESARPQ